MVTGHNLHDIDFGIHGTFFNAYHVAYLNEHTMYNHNVYVLFVGMKYGMYLFFRLMGHVI